MNDEARFWIKLASIPLAVQGLFLGLKLARVIHWPWWAVLSPSWGTVAALIVGGGMTFAALVRWGKQ